MGTTLTMAYYLDAQLCVVHVGDSRAYMFGDDQLEQITHDHTLMADWVRSGVIQPEEVVSRSLDRIVVRCAARRDRSP